MDTPFKKLYWIELEEMPIFEQLRLEEALLRTQDQNFCLINRKAPAAIVMGISGNPEKLVNLEQLKKRQIPLIRRFSGGGTVVVDENTYFVTWIMNREELQIPPFPESIHRWSASIFEKSWGIEGFHFRENDYCVGSKKCGGNAQYIQKQRWLHHTSFLWDFKEENMELLKLPEKRPKYRLDRSHSEFLTKLKHHAETPERLTQKLRGYLEKFGEVEPFDHRSLQIPTHRQSTCLVDGF